jgi:DNA-binding transcriptional regulator YiaG
MENSAAFLLKVLTVFNPKQLKDWRGVDAPYSRGKLSQREAADKIGVPIGTYRDWENGRHEPRGLALRVLLQIIRRKPRRPAKAHKRLR